MRRASVTMVPEGGPIQAPTHAQQESIITLLAEQNDLLSRLVIAIEAQALRPDVEIDINVSTAPTTLSRNNRRLTRIWVANAVSVLISNLHGGFAPFLLQAGWNYVDCVEGAQIMVQSGPSFVALWQCTDVITGAVL